MRFARYFGTSADVWLGLQTDYDLESAKDQRERIEQEVKVLVPA
jgi:plasmid maintenance system antidote protein VapI